MTLEFKKSGATDQEIALAEKYGIRYTKSQKKELKKTLSIKPPEDKDIAIFEKNYGIIFPEDYKDFLKKYNGGIPNKNIYTLSHVDYIVSEFLMLSNNKNTYNSIENHFLVFGDRIPLHTIPIGRSPEGDLFLLSGQATAKSKFGSILYWRHELESDEDGKNHWDNINIIANSFSEILNQLRQK